MYYKEKYNLSEAASIINIDKMGKSKIYKVLRELNIVDNNNKPYQEYIDAGYLDVRLPKVSTYYYVFQPPVTLVVGQRGLDFLKKTVIDYLEKNPPPTIKRERNDWWEETEEI